MSTLKKLIQAMEHNPKDVSFEDLNKVMLSFGFSCRQPGSGSSHYTYTRKDSQPLTVPKNRPIKAVYVRKALRLIENLQEENDGE